MKIPLVVVDDDKVDRYVVKRVLSKFEEFGEVQECKSGIEFLATYYSGKKASYASDQPLFVLMDLNMPGLSGLETIEEMEKRSKEGCGPIGTIVMMLTSSTNPDDRNSAEKLTSITGYTVKPLDKDGARRILKIYREFQKNSMT